MQDEDHPLGRGQPLEHDQQGEANLVVEGDPVGRVHAGGWKRLGPGRLDGGHRVHLLVAGARRADLIEADPAGDHRQPSPLVLDAVELGVGQPVEGLLYGVLGGADVAQHAEGQADQVGTVREPGVVEAAATGHVVIRHLSPPYGEIEVRRGDTLDS